MTHVSIDTPEEVLAAALFNAGLEEHRAGNAIDAFRAFAEAARLAPSSHVYALVACKASFGLARWDEAMAHLAAAQAAGLGAKTVQRMTQAINRAVAVGESNRLPVRFESDSPSPSESSWIFVLCDWLESAVHEFCENLRYSVASGRTSD